MNLILPKNLKYYYYYYGNPFIAATLRTLTTLWKKQIRNGRTASETKYFMFSINALKLNKSTREFS